MLRVVGASLGLAAITAGAALWVFGTAEPKSTTVRAERVVTTGVFSEKTVTTSYQPAANKDDVPRSLTVSLSLLGGGLAILSLALFPDLQVRVATPAGELSLSTVAQASAAVIEREPTLADRPEELVARVAETLKQANIRERSAITMEDFRVAAETLIPVSDDADARARRSDALEQDQA